MVTNRFSAKNVNEILRDEFEQFVDHSEKNSKIQNLNKIFSQLIEPSLAQGCQISNLCNGTLVIQASSAALLTRVKYQQGELLSAFRQAGFWDLCQLKFEVRPNANTVHQPVTPITTDNSAGKALTEHAAASLLAVAEIAPPELQERLRRLAAHS